MFTFTYEWLHRYYGSHSPAQEEQAMQWLAKYGKDLPDNYDDWAKFKHLIEYQVNTPDIVNQCFDQLGMFFETELATHAYVNRLRVPAAYNAYAKALEKIGPIRSIIELGVGGDSAISTACFLYHLERMIPKFKDPVILMSCDHNPLGMTAERYKNVSHWNFFQTDSIAFLMECRKNHVQADMIFIDTIHSYRHTLQELALASKMTKNILMDDATFEGNDFDEEPGGVKKAINEWMSFNHKWWNRTDFANGTVSLLQRIEITI